MNNFKIDKVLFKEIQAFVELNSLGDLNVFINNLIKKGFTSEKYDSLTFNMSKNVSEKIIKDGELSPIEINKEENIEIIKQENNNEEIDLYNE